MARTYWLDLFTAKTWQEFLNYGGTVSGFSENRWSQVQKMKKGDYLICYLTGISRFVGMLEVVGEAFQDSSPIWKDTVFPSRISVKPVVTLTPETAIPVQMLREQLDVFKKLKNPMMWSGAFRGSPIKWSENDGAAILKALQDAALKPIERALDPKKLGYRPKTLNSALGEVVIPESEPVDESTSSERKNEHLEIQWLLLKLGSDLGLDVWAARNDRNKEYNGVKFSDLPKMKEKLPLQFDDATNKTIELIDVLWLKGNSIQAAFEIESTTSIYSGLLRMADLLSMQPNLDIPVFIVAPDERREKVMSEIIRPTFRRLETPLHEVCRFIAFSSLRKKLEQVKDMLPYLKMEFIEEIAEPCEPDEP